jgi:hypothetical protein
MDLMQKIMSNKLVAPLIAVAAILSGVAAFTGTIDVLMDRYDEWFVEDEAQIRIGLDDSSGPVVEEEAVLEQFGIFASKLVTSNEPNNEAITISKNGLVVNISATASKPVGTPNYFIRSRGKLYEISPSDRYFDTLANGRIPNAEFDGWDFRLPVIDLKIVNNSNESVYLVKAIFNIRTSLADPSPYLTIDGSSDYFRIPIDNIGSGPVTDGVLDFSITDSSGLVRSHQILVSKIDSYCAECDLEEIFSSVYGVDTELFKREYMDYPNLPTEEEQRIARGAFNTLSLPFIRPT